MPPNPGTPQGGPSATRHRPVPPQTQSPQAQRPGQPIAREQAPIQGPVRSEAPHRHAAYPQGPNAGTPYQRTPYPQQPQPSGTAWQPRPAAARPTPQANGGYPASGNDAARPVPPSRHAPGSPGHAPAHPSPTAFRAGTVLPPSRGSAAAKAADRKAFTIAAVAVAVVVALFAVYFLATGWLEKRQYEGYTTGDLSMYGDNFDTSKYDLQPPRLNVSSDYAFETTVDTTNVDIEDYRGETADGVVTAAYTDPALTMRYPVQVRVDGDTITSSPASGIMCNQYWNPQDKTLHVGGLGDIDDTNCNVEGDYFDDHYGQWWGHGTYYFVEYYDEHGIRLTKPKVTAFTVRQDTHSLPTPQNVMPAITDRGTVKLNWDAVDGATHYKVYLQRGGPVETTGEKDENAEEKDEKAKEGTKKEESATFYNLYLLANVDDTTVDLGDWDPDNDPDHKDKVAAYRFDPDDGYENPIYQNLQFVDSGYWDSYFYSEDQFMGSYFDESKLGEYERNIDNTRLVVVAFGDDETKDNSAVSSVNVNALLSQIPVQPAYYTEQHYAPSGPTFVSYMTMADGMTRKMLNEFDWGTLSRQEGDTFTVTYTTPGTRLSGTATISGYGDDPGQVQSKVQQAKDELTKSDVQTGLMKDLYSSETVNWDGLTNPVTEAQLNGVNGTTEYVKFVAANLMQDKTYMDISKYASQQGAPDATDVVEEAVHQNPLILHALPSAYTKQKDGHTYLYVQYSDDPYGVDRTAQLRQQLDQKAGEIVSQIITDGMDEAAKASAINQYLVDTFTYDYDALDEIEAGVPDDFFKRYPSNQTALGLLGNVDGVDVTHTVCAGYASSFKLLADKAGLPAIWVSGVVSTGNTGGNHAWNKVQVGGQWVVVDSTWNDTGGGGTTDYLLLQEGSSLLTQRGQVYDDDAVLDSKLADYGLVS